MNSAAEARSDHYRPDRESAIIAEYERELSLSIGCLSRFIIRKHLERVTERGKLRLDSKRASSMAGLIAEEVSVLVGPAKSERIERHLRQINEATFPSEDGK
jgi:hypothetical protein